MRWTIAHTYVGSLFGALITCCGVVLFVSIYFMKVPIEDELNKGIVRMQQVISSANETTAQKFLQSADLIAEDDDFAKAVAEKNTDAAVKIGSVLMKKAGSDFMTITDEKGIVIGRGHSKKHGDSVTNQETVVIARCRSGWHGGAVHHPGQLSCNARWQACGQRLYWHLACHARLS